jgi:nucleoside 2-deoxyribosyltransferase
MDEVDKREVWRKYFFLNSEEFLFYIYNLRSQGLITWLETGNIANEFTNLSLTLEGLTRVIQITERKHSHFCFVAMSFSKELEEIYENAILPAIMETGFHPLIISKEHVESDKTINDAIIAAIKKSRFTIADFTEHKAGVYWEAGYALGRGQKVIYTCRKDHLNDAHFDTRNFQHIVWEAPEELKSLLIDKIEAYILD